ncbi:ABC transporter substrate-binding protein [Geobacter sp. DSM 9736]|uniref:ABC transporter substrate-binding protein n=1 Tax=Geobacter sp. DSM 9736 TaxID=1277350 RepID=UPI000B511229|nr:ABC transporter substrate binding protein [Geobacter sp. DSM 9736]SNB48103.1 putative ABC transport system substrate-binding protein [Geobacter sp. DSM 9736]
MRRSIVLILCLILWGTGAAWGYDLLLVQSNRSSVYDDVVRGFRSACGAESRLLVLSDYADADVVRVVREERPRLVVALGDEAMAKVRKLRQTPVLAVMTLGLHDGQRTGIAGIDMYVPPERYFPLFGPLRAERIGVLYDPAKTGWYVKRAVAAAKRAGVHLVLREVHNPREAVAALYDLKGKVDALWMIPDTTAVTRENLEAWFGFSLQQSVPVVSFTAAHLRMGAAAAVDIDRGALGRQAGELANRLLDGSPHAEQPVESPQTTTIKSNASVLKNLGFPANLLDRLADR